MGTLKKMFLINLSVFSILVFSPLTAMTAAKVAVEIQHHGTDTVGTRLTYQIKEGIRQSAGLSLTNANETRLVVYLVTTDEFDDMPGTATIFSWTIMVVMKGNEKPGKLITPGVGKTGAFHIKGAAESVIAEIDKAAELIRK